MSGGVFNDKIWSGNNNTGSITVFGDISANTPLTENAEEANFYDGDDIITIGNNNANVFAYGQGGNDKITGGFGSQQVEKLYGGSGDDKIWLFSPEQISQDTAGDYGVGNLGSDQLFGNDGSN